jgi:hypothetical protein
MRNRAGLKYWRIRSINQSLSWRLFTRKSKERNTGIPKRSKSWSSRFNKKLMYFKTISNYMKKVYE